MRISSCSHLPKDLKSPKSTMCEEHNTPTPFSLRVCLTCGHVGCCDSTPGEHAREHATKTGHQVMASYPADETSFIWCYSHDDYLEPDEKRNLKR